MTHESGNPSHREVPILLLAPSGRDAALVGRILRENRLDHVRCDGLDDVIRRLTHAEQVGAVVLADEAIHPAGAANLLTVLEAQPRWSDVPVIILTRGRHRGSCLELIAARQGSWLLRRPMRMVTFRSAVQAAVAYRRRQFDLRDLLTELRRVNQRLEQRTYQLQRLTHQLTQAEERERHRLADVLHEDLQQILVGVNYHLSLVPGRAGDEEALNETLGQVGGLIRDAIEKSRTMSHDLSPPILHHSGLVPALHWLGDQMHKAHGLEVHVEAAEEDEPDDLSVGVLLFRAAQELLFNVIKHAGTTQASVSLRSAGDELHLVIEDEGVGFDPRDVEPAENIDIGVGLFSIRERIDLLGGRLEVYSEPGRGSRFQIVLPFEATVDADRAAVGDGDAAAPPDQAERGSAQKLRILLVDDHEILRQGLRLLLGQRGGFDVVGEAGSGAEAVRAVEELQPDLVVMDVSMSDMDGIEATRRIKAKRPATRVIGLSMHVDQGTAERMRQAGAEAYLSKADLGERLIDAIADPAPRRNHACRRPRVI